MQKGASMNSVSSATLTSCCLQQTHCDGALRPAQREAEAAMRTLLAWFGDDPSRFGLEGTPTRVATAFPEFFSGYKTDPAALLKLSMMPNDGSGQLILL